MSRDLSKHQEGIVRRGREHAETIRAQKLSDLVAEIWLCEDDAAATKLWGRAQVVLMKAGCDATRAATVVGDRDTEALAELARQLDAGETPGAPGAAAGGAAGAPKVAPGAQSVADGRTIGDARREKAAAEGTDSLDEENLKRALKAFRRKLNTIRRDDESQLRGRYVTRGESSSIVAVTPPYDFPPEVWAELVRQGRLKRAGQGTYQLP